MIIENQNDFFDFLNVEEELILNRIDLHLNSPLKIQNQHKGKKVLKIIGKNSSIFGTLIVNQDIKFIGVNFIGNEHIIINSEKSHLEFVNCKFYSKSFGVAINLFKDAKSILSIDNSLFINFKTAIIINNNYIYSLKSSNFQNCKKAITLFNENAFLNDNNIINNFNLSSNEESFIEASKILNPSLAIKLAFNLTFNNNGSRIVFLNEQRKIDTKSFYVYNDNELTKVIKESPIAATIFLVSNNFSGDIFIDKPLSIIGTNNTTITPTLTKENSAAFIINSSFIEIKNITIKDSENLKFRDAIRFEELGGTNCKFIDLTITNVFRRGISIFGINSNETLIKNCKFSNILKQSAIESINNVYIENNIFENCTIALTIKTFGQITIINNNFKNIRTLLYCKEKYLRPIYIKGNKLSLVKNLLES
ncbi:MAG: hypothetical protein ACRDD2_01780 [Sarcina sp.]